MPKAGRRPAGAIIANRLRGKHKATFTPHMDMRRPYRRDQCREGGADRQEAPEDYYCHTGYPGGIKERKAHKVLDGRFPERVLEAAVRRMVPAGPLGRAAADQSAHLQGAEHPHEAQQPEALDITCDEPQELA